ncbi:MAG: hypothetical protein H6850_01735 [Alphaproteobacteria bacterium]|nr:MAG: hypothetical protein H6850_01735 [Alphaproteobacteria bacterium]
MHTNRKNKLLIITGPTASGKTDLALKKAKELGACIINADALQLYKDLPTLTARPLETEGVPHYLFGILEPYEKMNVARWLNLVNEILNAELSSRGAHDLTSSRGTQSRGDSEWMATPPSLKLRRARHDDYILTGGTAFYIKTFLQGGLSEIPDIPKNIEDYVRGLDKDAVYQEILKHDPEILNHVHRNNTHKLMRALAVKLATGKSIRDWRSGAFASQGVHDTTSSREAHGTTSSRGTKSRGDPMDDHASLAMTEARHHEERNILRHHEARSDVVIHNRLPRVLANARNDGAVAPAITVINMNKEELNQRIRARTHQMLESGAIDEVADLLKRYPNLLELPITKVIGVKEIVAYLNGEMTYDEMCLKIQTLTIQYAKRQRTFMRTLPSCMHYPNPQNLTISSIKLRGS